MCAIQDVQVRIFKCHLSIHKMTKDTSVLMRTTVMGQDTVQQKVNRMHSSRNILMNGFAFN